MRSRASIWAPLLMMAANNYAISLGRLRRYEEAKTLLREVIPVVRRVLGESHDLTFTTRCIYAGALYEDASATLDEIREAVKTLEDTERVARRVFGGAHPIAAAIVRSLRSARATLAAREETPSG